MPQDVSQVHPCMAGSISCCIAQNNWAHALQAVDTDEGDLTSQQGKRRAVPDEAEEGLSETEGGAFFDPNDSFNSAPACY